MAGNWWWCAAVIKRGGERNVLGFLFVFVCVVRVTRVETKRGEGLGRF